MTVLNSGSSGNGYVLQNDTEALVIECGCHVLGCEKTLHFNTRKVVGCLVTHEHQDHAKYIRDYAKYMPVYATAGTLRATENEKTINCNVLEMLTKRKLGGFTVLPFPTEHDAEEPCGFIIHHMEFGNLIFATDTYYLKYKFSYPSWFMLECNYDARLLQENVENMITPVSVAKRVRKSHMSLEQCIKTLQSNDLSEVKGIVLLHLSSNNSSKRAFLRKVQEATGRFVCVAQKGLEIEFV